MKRIFNFQFSIFNSRKGFSLIELLISITIIGILGSIILTSVSRSRARAFDSKIKQQLSSFRTAAEIYYANNGSTYGTPTSFCNSGMFNDFSPTNGSPGVYIADGNLPDFAVKDCESNGLAYTAKVSLYNGNEYWCVDSKGNSRVVHETLDTGDSDTVCPSI